MNIPHNVYAAKFGMAANTLGVQEGAHELKGCVEGQLIFNTKAQTAMRKKRWKSPTTCAIKLERRGHIGHARSPAGCGPCGLTIPQPGWVKGGYALALSVTSAIGSMTRIGEF